MATLAADISEDGQGVACALHLFWGVFALRDVNKRNKRKYGHCSSRQEYSHLYFMMRLEDTLAFTIGSQ